MQYTYDNFVKDLNGGKFNRVVFRVADYGHYRNCAINCRPIDRGEYIEFLFVPNGKDRVCYYGSFRDDKIFCLEHGVKYTLEQIWRRIEILQIDFRN